MALVMACLPADVGDLIVDRRVAFSRRETELHRTHGNQEVRSTFRKTVESAGKTIADEALDLVVRAIGGFAYMMQLVGYYKQRLIKQGIVDELPDGTLAFEMPFLPTT